MILNNYPHPHFDMTTMSIELPDYARLIIFWEPFDSTGDIYSPLDTCIQDIYPPCISALSHSPVVLKFTNFGTKLRFSDLIDPNQFKHNNDVNCWPEFIEEVLCHIQLTEVSLARSVHTVTDLATEPQK